MNRIRHFRGRIAAFVLTLAVAAVARSQDNVPPGFTELSLTVEGIAREALVYAPESAKKTPAPLVFVFHGHGGSARNAARQFAMQSNWPDAISVCMQGLNTPGRLTDPEGKRAGWQRNAGDQGDRDLKFFDAILARVKQDYQVDTKRMYATGHSNGGSFTYLLWAERGDAFVAFAPSSCSAVESLPKLKPKPAFQVAGSADPLVKFEWQQRMMEAVRKVNGCEAEGKAWDSGCTLYPSASGAPFISFIHPGGHVFPAEAPALIVKFFKEHPGA